MKYGHIQYIKLKLLILLSGALFFFSLSGICFYFFNRQLSFVFLLCMIIPLIFKRWLDNYYTREIIINPTSNYIDFTVKKHECEEGNLFRINFKELAGYRISEYGPKFMNIRFIPKNGKSKSLTFLRQKQIEYDELGDGIVNQIHELIKEWNFKANNQPVTLRAPFFATPMGLIILIILFFLFMDIIRVSIIYRISPVYIVLMIIPQISLWSIRIKDIRTYKKMKRSLP